MRLFLPGVSAKDSIIIHAVLKARMGKVKLWWEMNETEFDLLSRQKARNWVTVLGKLLGEQDTIKPQSHI